MKIAIVCPYSLSIPGGVQGQVLDLARVLRRKGHAARVIAPCDGPPPDASVIPVGSSVPFAANGSVAPIAPDPAAAARTMRAIDHYDFDVIHLHEPVAPGPCLTLLMTAPRPLVGTFHAAGGMVAYRMVGRYLKRITDHLDVKCAVSEDAEQLALVVARPPIERVFNGIDIERFASAEPWPTDGPTILFVGRHEPRKGLRVLVEAMGRIDRGDVRVWVGGSGPETDQLRAVTSGDDRFEWLGRIDDHELVARMRAADVFCAPSLGGESFGIVLLEAMAADTAIVAGDNPGYRKVARDGRDAVLVAPGDDVGLAEALTSVLDDAERRDRLVASGRQRAAEFSMEALADRYLELYEHALAAQA